MKQLNKEGWDWEEVFDSMFNWANQVKKTELARWQVMYGFQPKDLKSFIRETIAQSIAEERQRLEEEIRKVKSQVFTDNHALEERDGSVVPVERKDHRFVILSDVLEVFNSKE